jgi:hypothetical protein
MINTETQMTETMKTMTTVTKTIEMMNTNRKKYSRVFKIDWICLSLYSYLSLTMETAIAWCYWFSYFTAILALHGTKNTNNKILVSSYYHWSCHFHINIEKRQGPITLMTPIFWLCTLIIDYGSPQSRELAVNCMVKKVFVSTLDMLSATQY